MKAIRLAITRADLHKYIQTRAAGAVISLFIFLGVFAAYWASPVHQVSDSRWFLHVAESIVKEGNTDLDEYGGLISERDARIERVGSHLYSMFPIGTPLVAVPFVYVYDNMLSPEGAGIEATFINAQRMIASVVTALTAALLYQVSRTHLDTVRSLALALIFAFCTSAWSTASRALWQHGPSMLMLSATLYLLTLARRRPWVVQFASIPLACAYVIRPTNAISVLLVTLYVLWAHRRRFVKYVLLASLIAAPFVLYNWRIYGALLPPYYRPSRIGSGAHFFEALAGNLISPARGLLIFSPVCLLAPYGIYLKWRAGRLDRLEVILCLTIVAHWIAVSSFPHWWGGYSFGPRFFTDVMPYLIYLMIPAIAQLGRPRSTRHATYAVLVGLLVVTSVAIHAAGAISRDTGEWNASPASVDTEPARLWIWLDPQFLRGTSVLDPFTPPRVVVKPQRIRLLWPPGTDKDAQVTVFAYNIRGKPVHWIVRASDGLGAVVLQNDQGAGCSFQVAVPALAYPTGVHRVGEIEVIAQSGAERSTLADRVSFPIDITVPDRIRHVFLPAVFQVSE